MATWRDLLVCGIIGILLVLTAHRITEDQRVLCEHLYVPTKLIHDAPETVNRMLEICGYRNVRITSKENLGEQIGRDQDGSATSNNTSPTAP